MFRIAILSFWHVHAQDYAFEAENHPETEVSAVWDEDVERGRREAFQRGVPFYENLDELLSSRDIDGVVVTTPTTAHYEVIPAAARAGKHIFTEKVISSRRSEAQEIAAEVESAGVTFVVSLPRLYTGYTRAVRELLTSGEIGEPTYLRVRVSHDGAVPTDANPGGWLPEHFFEPSQSAGGVTVDFGAHPLYLIAHLLGMPDEVSAVYGYFTERAVEDNSVVIMRYSSGTIGVAEASFLGASTPFLVEAHGTEGGLMYDPNDGLRMRRQGDNEWSTVRVSADAASPFERWVNLSSEGRGDPDNVRTALALSALSESAHLSVRDRRPVRPDEFAR